MKPYKEKNTVVNIQGTTVKFRYPTFADKIAIEGMKMVITRGQYGSLAIGMLQSQQDTALMAEKIASLSVLVSFPDDKEDKLSFENLDPESPEDIAFINDCYTQYVAWRESFRPSTDKVDKPKPGEATQK
jgi:hypothetical protein